MKILITGASGFLAGFVIDRLKEHHELTFFDRVKPKKEGHFVEGDITDFGTINKACMGQDAVIHLVALVRKRFNKPHGLFTDIMVKGTWNVAEACVQQGVKKLVNISSIIAIGWPKESNHSYQIGEPSTFQQGDLFYCLAKHLGEEIGRAYHEAHGLKVINLRPGMIAGDGLNPDPLPPKENPGPYWFLYVHPEDVAQAIEQAIVLNTLAFVTLNVVAGHSKARFDWQETAQKLGYNPRHNWNDL